MGVFAIVLPVINDYTKAGFRAFIDEVSRTFALLPPWVVDVIRLLVCGLMIVQVCKAVSSIAKGG